ncbi:hypothetical protein L9F63_010899, partial [Diploptera punctata]
RISNKRLCGDPTCSLPVSMAKTLLQYVSDDSRLLSFRKNVDVVIYSKSAGSKPDLWGAEIKGKRGYIPKGFVREYKILKSPLTHIVDTEFKEDRKEIEKQEDSKSPQNTTPTISSSLNKNADILKSDEGSGKTPSLEDASLKYSVFPDVTFSFPGSGVSAEPLESETPPKLEDISQPYEVIDGTTLSYDTDGSQSETKVPLHPTSTVQNADVTAKHDDSSTASPEESVTTDDDGKNSNEVKTKSEEDNASDEGSAGPIYQYFSNWIAEGSGNVMEKKEEDENEEEEEDEEEEEEIEDDYDDLENEYDEFKKIEIPESVDKNEIKSVEESKEEINKRSGISEEIEEEKNFEKPKAETETIADIETSAKKDIDIEGDQNIKNLGESEDDSVVKDVQNKTDSEKDKFIEEDLEKVSIENQTESVDNTENEETQKDMQIEDEQISRDDEEIPLDNNVATGENVEKPQETSDDIQSETPVTSTSDSISTESSDVEDTQKTDEIVGSNETDKEMSSSAESTEDNLEESAEDVSEEVETVVSSNETDTQEMSSSSEDTGDELEESAAVVSGSDFHVSEKTETVLGSNETDTLEVSSSSEDTGDKLEESTVGDNNLDVKVSEETETVTESSDNENEGKFDIPTKESQVENTGFETTTSSSSESGEFEEVTEPSTSEEIEVPELPEETTTISSVVPDSSELEDKTVIVEEISMSEESSRGYFSWVNDIFGNLFNAMSPDIHVAEDANESEVKDASEEIFKGDDSENIKEKEAGLASFWETVHKNTGPESYAHGSCNKNSDSSVGIDSDCSDVSGEQSNYMKITKQQDTAVVKELEDTTFKMDFEKSFDAVICLIITGATVIIVSLGYFYLENKRRDGSLVAKINQLEKALLVSSKECLILNDDLQATREKLLSVETASVNSNETATSLHLEIENFRLENSQLKEQVSSLEKELEIATEAGLELNRMFSDVLTQNSSETMMKSVDHLQKQLDSQQNTITTLTESLSDKTAENENLQSDLDSALEKINFLEDDIQKVNEHLTRALTEKLKAEEELKEKEELWDLQRFEVNSKNDAEVSELRKEITNLQETINEQRNDVVTKENEILVLQDCLNHLKTLEDGDVAGDKIHALLDVGHIKAELKLLKEERDVLAEKLLGEEDARKLLE